MPIMSMRYAFRVKRMRIPYFLVLISLKRFANGSHAIKRDRNKSEVTISHQSLYVFQSLSFRLQIALVRNELRHQGTGNHSNERRTKSDQLRRIHFVDSFQDWNELTQLRSKHERNPTRNAQNDRTNRTLRGRTLPIKSKS